MTDRPRLTWSNLPSAIGATMMAAKSMQLLANIFLEYEYWSQYRIVFASGLDARAAASTLPLAVPTYSPRTSFSAAEFDVQLQQWLEAHQAKN